MPAKRYQLKDQEISARIILEGYSLGGGIAINTAFYFKIKYSIDISTFVNRSFSSYSKAAGGFYENLFDIPRPFGEALHKLFFVHAGII